MQAWRKRTAAGGWNSTGPAAPRPPGQSESGPPCSHTKANDFIVDALAQILFDAVTQCVLQVPDNTGGGIANRQSGTGADYWYQKNTRAAAVILDSKCNGLAQRRSDADIRKQAQHHPAYTEADILFVAAEQAEKILDYHSILSHGLFAPVQGRKFQISAN